MGTRYGGREEAGRSPERWRALLLPTLVVLLTLTVPGVTRAGKGADRGAHDNPSHEDPARELLRLRIEGLANYEGGVTLKNARDQFEAALELQPDSAIDLFNLGNLLRKLEEGERARQLLQQAMKADPTLPHPHYVMGLLDKAEGRSEQALAHFQKARELAPAEPSVYYQIGLLQRSFDNEEEALQAVTHSLGLDPFHSGTLYQLYQHYSRVDELERAREVMSEFSRLKRAAGASRREYNYDEGPLSTPILGIEAGLSPRPKETFQAVFERSEVALPEGTTSLAWVGVDSGGRAEIVAVGGSGGGVLVKPQPEAGGLAVSPLRGEVESPAAAGEVAAEAAEPESSPAGAEAASLRLERLEVEVFAPEEGMRLVAAGNGAPAVGKVDPAAGAIAWTLLDGGGGILAILDLDHDGDLDLLAEGGRVYRNSGTGDMELVEDFLSEEVRGPLATATGAVAAGLADVLDSVDLLVWDGDGRRTFIADHRGGSYGVVAGRPRALPGLTWSAAADLDNDGRLDLVSLAGGRLVIERNAGRFTLEELFAADDGGRSGAVADFDNDGWKDVVTLAAGRAPVLWHNQGDGSFKPLRLEGAVKELSSGVLAVDLEGDGLIDIAARSGDALVVWRNASSGTGNWMKIRLKGIRSAPSGRFARLETRVGSAYQLVESGGGVVHLGLGPAEYAEVLRLTWPNGFVENKFKVDVGNTWELEESERVSGSCPTVFAWDGERFGMITDAFISGPMGVPYAPGRYFPVDDDEYLKIPAQALVPRDGRLQVRITEELRETVYIDQVRLFALDRPADAEVHPNERLSPEGFPEPGIHCTQRAAAFPAARGSRGEDLTQAVSALDGVYADTVRPAPYTGFAEPHGIELRLPPEAAAGGHLRLFLTGWFYYFDSTSMMAAAQRKDLRMEWPQVQVWRDGSWQTLAIAGLPMGKHKTVVVDLSGKLLAGEDRLRLWTNAAVYWDAIRWDASTPCDGSENLLEAPLLEGRLRFRGFSTLEREPLASVPEHFDYHRLTLQAPWNPMRGTYTRYGDVLPLLSTVDSLLAVFGSGDELVLDFDATGLPAPPEGMERDWLLYLNGFVKDGDAYTAHAGQVAPMPYAGMTEYPYDDPPAVFATPAYRRYLETYQTRAPLRFVGPRLSDSAGDRPYGPAASAESER
jgi:hypothetical protein